jgi:hypothetical protein
MNGFDKEKVKKAQEAVDAACLKCGDKHKDECPINMARLALRSVPI